MADLVGLDANLFFVLFPVLFSLLTPLKLHPHNLCKSTAKHIEDLRTFTLQESQILLMCRTFTDRSSSNSRCNREDERLPLCWDFWFDFHRNAGRCCNFNLLFFCLIHELWFLMGRFLLTTTINYHLVNEKFSHNSKMPPKRSILESHLIFGHMLKIVRLSDIMWKVL